MTLLLLFISILLFLCAVVVVCLGLADGITRNGRVDWLRMGLAVVFAAVLMTGSAAVWSLFGQVV